MNGNGWGGPPAPDPQESAIVVAEPVELGDDITWRIENLLLAGFDMEAALLIAQRRQIDLHYVINLIDRGCSHELALQIVT